MREWLKFMGFGAVIVFTFTALWILFIPWFAAGKFTDRAAQKFDAETSAQVYDNSREYQQGTNRDIARYCRQWHDADPSSKKAVADLIHSTLDTYQGPVNDMNQQCVKEIK